MRPDDTRCTRLPFQRPGAKVRISSAGGGSHEMAAGHQGALSIFEENTLMAVAVRGGGSEIEVGEARPLFQTRLSTRSFPYAVTENGQRFLLNKSAEESSTTPITLVVNWPGLLER